MVNSKTLLKLPYWVRVVTIFFFGWAIIWIYRTVLNPIYPEIKRTFGITLDSQMSLIPTVFYAFYTMFQIPFGLLADRYGRKRIVISAFSIFSIGLLVISLSKSFAVIIIGAALVGIGQSAYFGCAYSITNSVVVEKKRSFASAIVNSGCAIGIAIGLISSSYLVKKYGMDWRVLLRALSIVTLFFAAIYYIFLEKDAQHVQSVKQANSIPFKKVIQNPKLIAAFFLYFATCYGYYMIITWLPSFLQSERNIEGVMIGYISSIVAFTSVPGALFISRLADKYKDRKIKLLVILELLSTVTLFMAIMSSSTVSIIIWLACYGFIGKIVVDPILISYVVDYVPKETYSRALSFLNFSGMLASIVSSYSTGLISDATGTKIYGYYIACILLIVSTTLLIFVNSKKKKFEN